MAAALLAKILSDGYTPECLRGDAVPAVRVVCPTVVAPQRFVVPRPVKPSQCFATILHWKEEDGLPSPREAEGDYGNRHEYLRSGGMYTSKVLILSRLIARENTDARPTTTYEAPPWPPTVSFAPNPPTQGLPPVPFASPDLACVESPGEYKLAPLTTTVCGPIQESHKRTSDLTAPRPGYFFGRDGTEWPLPPTRRCIPYTLSDSPELSPPQRDPASLTRADSRLGAHRVCDIRPMFHRASNNSSATSTAPSSEMLTTPPGLPSAREQQKKSKGVGTIGDGRPRDAVKGTVTPQNPNFVSALGLDLGIGKASFAPTKRSIPHTKGGFFLGKDGNLWPLPPDEIFFTMTEIRRGRDPLPKW